MDDPNGTAARRTAAVSRINTEQDYQVRYWTQESGVTAEQLREAVERVGSSADRVREHLRQVGR